MTCPPYNPWVPPTVADFMAFFNRDFPYAGPEDPNNLNLVQPADITKAINQGLIDFNPGLYGSLAQITNVFYYLAAYYLVANLQVSAKGIASKLNFPVVSAGVAGVNEAYQVPERYLKSPVLAPYTMNGYGMIYLSLAIPFLIGNVRTAFGIGSRGVLIPDLT